jgi:glycosyltransferase involved in cell wall biosynthesis
MRKTKIGIVVNDLSIGGVAKVVIDICNRLDNSIFDIHLILLSQRTEMEDIIPLNGLVKKYVVEYEFINNYRLTNYLKTAFVSNGKKLNRAKNVLQKISELKLDILHFHTLPRQLYIGHLAKKTNPNLKLVFTDHLIRLSESNYKWYQKFLLELAYRKFYRHYHLIAVSTAVFHSISTKQRNSKGCEFGLLENSINISEYSRTKPLQDFTENQFIYVSRINNHKGQETLIKSWLKINSSNKGKLLLVGPDESNGKFKQLAKNDSSIIFTGGVPNVKKLLNESNFAIFPSQKEGLPIALLEMMAFELPIIVSNIPELTTIISDKKEGIHFKLDDIEELILKIEYFIANKSETINMGIEARKKVENICIANDSVRFHNQFYKKIMEY